jgi:hypothetical protein
MAGEAEAYLIARNAFENIQAEVAGSVEMMRVVFAAVSKDPSSFAFSHMSGAGDARDGSTEVVVDARDWMSAEDLMALIARWRAARETLRSAWFAVPKDLQAGLLPPQAFAQIRRER